MTRRALAATLAGAAVLVCWARRRSVSTSWAPPRGTSVDAALPARIVGRGEVRCLLLHGMFNSGWYWGRHYDALGAAGALVVPDLLGFGRAPRPPSGYTADAHADAVAATLRAVGATRPVVVGAHSAGSLVALRLAVRHPDLVAAIVAIAPPIYRTPAQAARQIAAIDPVARVLTLNEPLCRALCELMARFRRTSAFLVSLARPALPRQLARDRVEHSWASYHETLSNLVLSARAATWVASTAVPVLLLAGDRDRAVDGRFLAELAARHAHVRLRLVRGGDHDLPLTHPAACVAELARAVEDCSAA